MRPAHPGNHARASRLTRAPTRSPDHPTYFFWKIPVNVACCARVDVRTRTTRDRISRDMTPGYLNDMPKLKVNSLALTLWPRGAAIDLDAEVARVDELLFELEVQALEQVHANGSRGIHVPAMEELEALFVRLAEEHVLRMRHGESAAGFRAGRISSRSARVRREPYAPDRIEEDGIRAVVQLVAQDVGRERDRAVSTVAPFSVPVNPNRLILPDDPLEVVERQLHAPSLVEEEAGPQLYCGTKRLWLKMLVQALLSRACTPTSVKSLPSDGWRMCRSLFV